MVLSRSLPTTLLLSLLLVACKEDPAQPPAGGISFPLNPANVWIYETTHYDAAGYITNVHPDTARVTGAITRSGRTGTRINTGYSVVDNTDSSEVVFSLYNESAYSVEGNTIYCLLDVEDLTSFYGTRWIKIVDEAGTTWTELDTTVTVSPTESTRTVLTSSRNDARTIKVKGVSHVGREYTLTTTTTAIILGVPQQSLTTKIHYWIAPDIGILAFRDDPYLFDSYERILVDYTVQ